MRYERCRSEMVESLQYTTAKISMQRQSSDHFVFTIIMTMNSHSKWDFSEFRFCSTRLTFESSNYRVNKPIDCDELSVDLLRDAFTCAFFATIRKLNVTFPRLLATRQQISVWHTAIIGLHLIIRCIRRTVCAIVEIAMK